MSEEGREGGGGGNGLASQLKREEEEVTLFSHPSPLLQWWRECVAGREKTLKTNFDLSVPSFPSFPPSFFSIYGFLAPKPPRFIFPCFFLLFSHLRGSGRQLSQLDDDDDVERRSLSLSLFPPPSLAANDSSTSFSRFVGGGGRRKEEKNPHGLRKFPQVHSQG